MLLVFRVSGFYLALLSSPGLHLSRLLCPSLTGLFLIMGLWHFSWGSRGAGAAWRLGVLDVQVLGVTATAPLSPMLTQPGF